jgi:hypothetical protein
MCTYHTVHCCTLLICLRATSVMPHQPDDVSPSGMSHHRRTSRPGTGAAAATSTTAPQTGATAATATPTAAAAANARLSMKRGSVQLQQQQQQQQQGVSTASNRLSMMGPGTRQSVMGGGREIEVRTT